MYVHMSIDMTLYLPRYTDINIHVCVHVYNMYIICIAYKYRRIHIIYTLYVYMYIYIYVSLSDTNVLAMLTKTSPTGLGRCQGTHFKHAVLCRGYFTWFRDDRRIGVFMT